MRWIAAVSVVAAVALFGLALYVRLNFEGEIAVYLNNRDTPWPFLTAPAIALYHVAPYVTGLLAVAACFIAVRRKDWSPQVLAGVLFFGFVSWLIFEKGILYALRPVI